MYFFLQQTQWSYCVHSLADCFLQLPPPPIETPILKRESKYGDKMYFKIIFNTQILSMAKNKIKKISKKHILPLQLAPNSESGCPCYQLQKSRKIVEFCEYVLVREFVHTSSDLKNDLLKWNSVYELLNYAQIITLLSPVAMFGVGMPTVINNRIGSVII